MHLKTSQQTNVFPTIAHQQNVDPILIKNNIKHNIRMFLVSSLAPFAVLQACTNKHMNYCISSRKPGMKKLAVRYKKSNPFNSLTTDQKTLQGITAKQRFRNTELSISEHKHGWKHSTVAKILVSASKLSVSCVTLVVSYVTNLFVKHPLSVSRPGQLSLPSLWGW